MVKVGRGGSGQRDRYLMPKWLGDINIYPPIPRRGGRVFLARTPFGEPPEAPAGGLQICSAEVEVGRGGVWPAGYIYIHIPKEKK